MTNNIFFLWMLIFIKRRFFLINTVVPIIIINKQSFINKNIPLNNNEYFTIDFKINKIGNILLCWYGSVTLHILWSVDYHIEGTIADANDESPPNGHHKVKLSIRRNIHRIQNRFVNTKLRFLNEIFSFCSVSSKNCFQNLSFEKYIWFYFYMLRFV